MMVATILRKNRKITRTTRTIVPTSVSITSCKDSRTEIDRSLTGVRFTD